MSTVFLLADCPTVTFTPSGGTVSQYSTFTCSAAAHPNVSHYTLTATTGDGVVIGQTFNLTSLGDYNVSCTAINYLMGGTSSPCSITTTVAGRTVTESSVTGSTVTGSTKTACEFLTVNMTFNTQRALTVVLNTL